MFRAARQPRDAVRLAGEFIVSLNAQRVRYLIIGGYAVAFHARPRATRNIDVLAEKLELRSVGVMLDVAAVYENPLE